MGVFIHDVGVWKPATVYIRDVGVWKLASTFVRDVGVWKPATNGLNAVAAPTTINYFVTVDPDITSFVTTADAAVVTPSGGTGPYVYVWAYVSGSTDITPTAGGSATTQFTAPVAFGARDAVWRCFVTDANGLVAEALVAIHIEIDFS